MGNHTICSKLDRALVAYIIDQKAGTAGDTWPAKRSLDKSVPCNIVWTHTAKVPQDMPYAGNYLAEAFVEIRTPGVQDAGESEDQPREDSEARVSAVVDAFQMAGDNSGEQLAQRINQAAAGVVDDFSVLSCRVIEVNQGFNPRALAEQGNCWLDTLHLEVLCAPVSGLNDPESLTP